jgi:hypothetical protein
MPDGTFDVRAKCPHCGEENEYRNFIFPSRYMYNKSMYCRYCRYRYNLVSFRHYLYEKSLIAFGTFFPSSLYLIKVYANALKNAILSMKNLVISASKGEAAG